MVFSNDGRGWVMTSLSGVACAFGAAIICVDILIRFIPGKRNFRIQDSDTFMSVSLSLSFGVMLFSSLYSMLPSAKQSLIDGGNSPKKAGWILIACFIGGVLGIQILSRVLHHFIPSHVVDCEHSHDEEAQKVQNDPHDSHRFRKRSKSSPTTSKRSSLPGHLHARSDQSNAHSHAPSRPGQMLQLPETASARTLTEHTPNGNEVHHTLSQTASIPRRMTRKLSQITSGRTATCTCDGPCYGFTDPCGNECFKKIIDRGGYKAPSRNGTIRPGIAKSATVQNLPVVSETTPLLDVSDRQAAVGTFEETQLQHQTAREDATQRMSSESSESFDFATSNGNGTIHRTRTNETMSSHGPEHHHHHVPTNAFLSIGLQTSIAIALHKLPEGFITYATNHANPQLGVAVFLALFIHNITEGFAMALPLYLALQSRIKAMLVSVVLGGFSQPLGAGIAAIWFHLAGKGNWAPDETVYGAMFAVTAGIMASVALQLFSESLDLTHSKALCMIGAFSGMGILGISSALTS